MRTISPKEINSHIEKILTIIEAEYDPEQVPVIIEEYAIEKNCYGNVEKKVKMDGGKIHYGWVVWQGDILCEAEHHAVWENSNGELLDITPRDEPYDTIMFISDNSKIYSGTSFDNIRINITGNPLIDDFILLSEAIEKIYMKFSKRNNDVTVKVPSFIAEYIHKYEILKGNLYNFYLNKNKIGSPCYCNSYKLYKSCHGKDLQKIIEKDLRDAHNKYNN